jgi:leucyl-tRNA synthetase
MVDKSRNFGKYNPSIIEPHWQSVWYKTKIYEPDLEKSLHPFYNLMMFPYPSAEGLHVGNVFAFVGSDIYGRFMAMNGYDVFEPIGFDAFGIHSENYAIKKGVHPSYLTAQNVEHFRETQLKRSGNRYDWSHEVNTSHPDYYKWTQWIFLQLYKAGLAFRKYANVNWCPSCKTVLADEQVIEGLCERCNTPVILRELEQWFFKITEYTQHLLDNLNTLDWSEIIKTAQRNWIGRSEGLEFSLTVEGHPGVVIPVFTTRPDTIYGMTYVVLAPENHLVDQLIDAENRQIVTKYREAVLSKSELDRISEDKEKTGIFLGCYAINPINHDRIPVWIADYVLSSYATGSIMAVPAHDYRDFLFAKSFGLPIKKVIIPVNDSSEYLNGIDNVYINDGKLINSDIFNGLRSVEAASKIIKWFEDNKLGERKTFYRLRDWLISRQRYWGPPIPIVYCNECGIVPLHEDQLPVLLPYIEDWIPKGTGSSPLAQIDSFVNTTCPKCGGVARRETDVSDNFLDSAWYFLRYPSTKFDDRPFDNDMTLKWLPVDMYIGGPEHSVLHLLYSRFITMALHDQGLLPFDEPFAHFRAHGIITKNGAKMSKSRGNVVNPDKYIEKYGADTLRMYLMFLGPYDRAGDFNDDGIAGIQRFLNRLWDLVEKHSKNLFLGIPPLENRKQLHYTIHKVSEDINNLKYNTAIATFMSYLNILQRRDYLCKEEIETFLLLLAPFSPHITEELWSKLGFPYSIHQMKWPQSDPTLLIRETINIAVQINGRVRTNIDIPIDADQEEAMSIALDNPKLIKFLGVSEIANVYYKQGQILNLVIRPPKIL